MRHLDWIKNISQFPEVQERIEEDCETLIQIHFNQQDDYAIEKFLKVYTESFRYLEHLMLLQRNVAPEDFQNGSPMDPKEAYEKQQEVKKVMLTEVQRQYRHTITFIPNLKTVVHQQLDLERKNFTLLENAIESTLSKEDAAKVYKAYSKLRNH